MNTDRELLDLAAKAAGIKLNNAAMQTMYMGDDGQWVFWNPLKDDGDALRLAVRLGLQIFPDDLRDCTVALVQDNDDRIACAEKYDDDGLTATRRAIVRAAAAIGGSMP